MKTSADNCLITGMQYTFRRIPIRDGVNRAMAAMTDQELEDLLRAGESDRRERKRNASNLDRIRQAVCAFANDLPDCRQPSVVFVGIEDDGGCANLPIDDELLRTLGQIRDDGSLTPFPSMEVRAASLFGC